MIYYLLKYFMFFQKKTLHSKMAEQNIAYMLETNV